MAVLLFLLCLKAVLCFRITCEIFRHFLKLCQNIIFVTKKGKGFGKRPAHGIYYKSPLLLWTLLHLGSESARRSDCLAREKNGASQKKMGDWGEGGLPSFYLFINFFSSFSLAPFVARAPLPERLEQAHLGLYSHYTG